MTTSRKTLYILATIAGIFFLPYLSSYILFGGNFPANFFDFPPLVAPSKPGFNWIIFLITALLMGGVALVYLYPRLFGFKKSVGSAPPPQPPEKVALPTWFWVGLVAWGVTLCLLWGKFSAPTIIINWAAIPLYWGFTLMLDGWVYVRTGGRSLFNLFNQELIAIGAASIPGWLIFEYLNFYVDENWIYPAGNLIGSNEFFIYAVVGSSGLMPMCFEVYYLLKTVPSLNHRFDNGPIIRMSNWAGNLILLISFGSLFGVSYFPDALFGTLWVAPLCILFVVLTKLNLWTPFTPIAHGNWTPALLFNLTYLLLGFLVEFWNYFSAYHRADGQRITHNPDYWSYSVPYVDVIHVFEMPLLGFLGYLPFGLYCAVWWLSFCYLLNIPTILPRTDGLSTHQHEV